MNPENLSVEALGLFNRLSDEGRSMAMALLESLTEDEAVYVATLRTSSEKERRRLIFMLSRRKWGLK